MAVADIFLRLRANSAELTKGLDQAKNSMKKTNDAASTLSKGISNTFQKAAKSIDSVIPGFSKLVDGLTRSTFATNAFSGSLKIMKTALIATGIGAILVALGSLIAYFKGTKDGADKFNKALGGIKAVIETLMTRIRMLGEAISLVLQGKFKQAAEKAKEAFSDLGAAIKENYKEGRAIAERENELKKAKNQFLLRESELTRDIAKYTEIAADKDADINDRKNAIAKVEGLITTLGEERTRIAQEEYDILVAKNALGDNTYEDDMNEAQLRANINNIKEEEYQKMRRINSLGKSIGDDSEREQKAREEILKSLKEQNAIAAVSGPTAKKIDTTNLVNIDINPTVNLDNVNSSWDLYKNKVFTIWQLIEDQASLSLFNINQSIINVGETLTNVLTGSVIGLTNELGNLFAGAETGFKSLVTAALAAGRVIINMFLAQAIAGMIAGESKKGLIGLVTASIGVSMLLALWKTKVPEFAAGGIVSGPTLGLVGEYSNARTNPEVIAPLDKLQSMLGNNMNITVDGIIKGSDLALVLRRVQPQN